MKKLLILSVALVYILASCNPYGSEIPEKINGCWINPVTGELSYGFFEEFAIYNNDFWRYYSVSDNQIVLYKDTTIREYKIGEKVLPNVPDSLKSFINYSFINDSVLEIDGKHYQKNDYSRFSKYRDFDIYGCYEYLYQKFQNRTAVEDDTTDFLPHKFERNFADTNMLVRCYQRNTAKGINSFRSRFNNMGDCYSILTSSNSYQKIWFVHNSAWIDTLSHYGYRFECPIYGGLPLSMLGPYSFFKFWGESVDVPYYIESNDTMMFVANQETFNTTFYHRFEHYAMGRNSRYIQEQDALYYYVILSNKDKKDEQIWFNQLPYNSRQILGDSAFYAKRYNKYVEDTTLLYNFIKECKVPLSYKFKRFNRNYLFNSFMLDVIGIKEADDYFAQDLHFNEDDMMLFPNGSPFIFQYVLYKDSIQYCQSFPSDTIAHIAVTKENMQKYPDYIPYRVGAKHYPVLINPQMVKNLGFSNDFCNWFVYKCVIQYLSVYYEYDAPDKRTRKWVNPPLEDYEIEHIYRIVKEPYVSDVHNQIEWKSENNN